MKEDLKSLLLDLYIWLDRYQHHAWREDIEMVESKIAEIERELDNQL